MLQACCTGLKWIINYLELPSFFHTVMSFELKVSLRGEPGSPTTHLFPLAFLGTCVIYKYTFLLLKTHVVGFLVYVCAPQPKTSYLSWYFGVLLCYEDSKSWSIDYNQTWGYHTPNDNQLCKNNVQINYDTNIGKGSFSILAIKIVWVKEAIFKFTKQSLQPRTDG